MVINGYVYFGSSQLFGYALNSPFQFHELIDNEGLIRSYGVFVIAAWSFFFGVLLAPRFKRKKATKINSGMQKHGKWAVSSNVIVILYTLTMLSLHVGWGIDHLYSRTGYTLGSSEGTHFRTVFVFLLPVTCLLLPMYPRALTRISFLILLFVVVQGTNSRTLVLIPAFYFLGILIRDKHWSTLKFAIASLFAIFSLIYVMEYRYHESQGVIPNLVFLVNNGIDLSLINIALNYIFAYSFYATAYTVSGFDLDFTSFLISVNPLPSAFLDINHMIETQMLNKNAPFTAIGTLALSGLPYLITYFFLAGFAWKLFRDYSESRSALLLIVITILFLLFMIFCTQYNLRGVTRYVYYAGALVFGFSLMKIFIITGRQALIYSKEN